MVIWEGTLIKKNQIENSKTLTIQNGLIEVKDNSLQYEKLISETFQENASVVTKSLLAVEEELAEYLPVHSTTSTSYVLDHDFGEFTIKKEYSDVKIYYQVDIGSPGYVVGGATIYTRLLEDGVEIIVLTAPTGDYVTRSAEVETTEGTHHYVSEFKSPYETVVARVKNRYLKLRHYAHGFGY